MKVDRWIRKIGWTTAVLARQLGVSHQAAAKIVKGGRPNPENSRKIIELSGGKVTWDDLYPPSHKQASNG
jgi:transcriptional regulator with XRE-family HTH domain